MWKNKQNRANMKQSIQNPTLCPRRDENDTKQNETTKQTNTVVQMKYFSPL